MNNLLIFFAFPIAVIIFSYALQKLLKNPVLVAAIIFSVFLIVTFSAFTEDFLIATLAYTIISFTVAILTKILCSQKAEQVSDENDENIITESASENTNNNCCCNRYRRF